MPRRCPVLVFDHELPKSGDSLHRINSADAPGLQMGLKQIMRLFGHEAQHFSAESSLKLNDAVITAPTRRPRACAETDRKLLPNLH
ncbi:hypothetical protein CEXT_469141 [Caerostris extrusa]|uniref:Uncharacterized protein n=1 Tax=Caerostris extrusa TaxID=172846 RepID=A0AAV4R5A4_CAEEX|nr:hypothetical protein CEXT_469141 [Caerostris extrusa]